MKLKEFSLWGFKLELVESRKFTLFNRCVCAHFERHFEPIETDGVYRIVIKLSEPDERAGTNELSSSVLKFYKEFNFSLFYSLDELSRKKQLLDVLYESLIQLCDLFGWPKDNFNKAYELVIKDNYLNVYSIKKKSNRNKTLCAELTCDHSTDSFECYILVKDKLGKEIYHKLLFSEEPDEFMFNGRIGDIKWLSNDILVHLKKDKTELERFEFKKGAKLIKNP
ncbi:MAG: hypothetical protein COB61_005370 [Thiotrichales bacterium]|nr:hypothetical protein [Thiotrichales bacterium]